MTIQDDELVTITTLDRVVVARSQDPDEYVGQPLPPDQFEDTEVAPGRFLSSGVDFEGESRTWARVFSAVADASMPITWPMRTPPSSSNPRRISSRR